MKGNLKMKKKIKNVEYGQLIQSLSILFCAKSLDNTNTYKYSKTEKILSAHIFLHLHLFYLPISSTVKQSIVRTNCCKLHIKMYLKKKKELKLFGTLLVPSHVLPI